MALSPSLPPPKVIHVDIRGAVILTEESAQTKDSRGIYLPNHIEPVSHVAVDIGGSLAKVVYFTRSPDPSIIATQESIPASCISSRSLSPDNASRVSAESRPSTPRGASGALTPLILESPSPSADTSPGLPASGCDDAGICALQDHLVRDSLMRHKLTHFPGGSLNFERFETDNIHECVEFIQNLIERSAQVNGVSIEEMRKSVKIMATGGGAQKFYDLFRETLCVDVRREDEMQCLIEGLKFMMLIPDEVYYFSDELIQSVSHHCPVALERPSPRPPPYEVTFETNPTPHFPCLLVNIGSGVSIIKVDEDGRFERVSGTSLGGGTLWGLLSLLTPATSFDDMLTLSEKGDNANVDMLVGDIYGQDYSKLGLKSTVIASTFGKVFKKGREKIKFSPEDISQSLLYAVSNNIGQIAYMNAETYNLDRIYFGGCFIRGHAATIATLSYAIRFWSKGTKRALFLRHEGFLGAVGAWIRNIDDGHDE